MARNRYNSLYEQRHLNTNDCIFISHQKDDSRIAKLIADYIINAGIDVYFDEYDSSIDLSNPHSVVNAIKKGIQNSTYMLCLLTKNAMKSKWMPWEIGYGYERTKVIGLTDKDICKEILPEYLQIVPILRGTKSLNSKLSIILNKPESQLITERRMYSATTANHPLDDVLNWEL